MQHALSPRPTAVPAHRPVAPAPLAASPDVAPDVEETLSRLFGVLSEQRRDLGALLLTDPRTLLRLRRMIRRLPALTVRLPRSGDHREVARALRGYAASRRLTLGVTAVLELPAAAGAYTDGRSRATLRRKIRAAERRGVTVRPVPDADRLRMLALADAHERNNLLEQYRSADPRNEDLLDYPLWLAAYDCDGEPLVLSVTPFSGPWATLRYFRTLEPGEASSDARYLLAAALAETLRASGVRHLVDATRPHWLPNGLRHFQRMLGFRLVRLSEPRLEHRRSSRR